MPNVTEQTQISALVEQIERFTGKDGLYPTAIAPLALFRHSASTEPFHATYRTALCIVAQGCKQVILGEKSYMYDAEHYLVASVELPTIAQIVDATPEKPFLALQLDFDLEQIGEMMMESGSLYFESQKCEPGLFVSRYTPDLRNAILRLLNLLETPKDIPVLAPLIIREIIYRLLSSENGAALRQITAMDGQAQYVVQAIDWLKENYSQPLSISEMARKLHISPSSLHHFFKAVTAMSPLQYQKHLRLQEARRLMLLDGLPVAIAGKRVGYGSPAQFSREYRRLFGQAPLVDISSLRKNLVLTDQPVQSQYD